VLNRCNGNRIAKYVMDTSVLSAAEYATNERIEEYLER
jgi:hypothetical protein